MGLFNKKKLNWQSDELEGVPDEANPYSSKIECYMQGTRDYIKYIKRGYGRISQNMSTLLRSKSIDIDKAKELIKEIEDLSPAEKTTNLQKFLKLM